MIHLSIRKIFFNLKMVLLALGAGVTLLMLQVIHISQYGERLAALKNQHLLIDKIVNSDLSDPQMAAIIINGAVAEISLSVKLSGAEAMLDSLLNSNEEQASLLRSLELSSKAFQDNAIIWSESLAASKDSNRERMFHSRSAYLADINRMVDYQINVITQSIATAKITAVVLFFLGLVAFLFYRYRLNTIYQDINQACSVDTEGSEKKASTREIDFIIKQLARRSSQPIISQSLLNPFSGLNNEKGLTYLFNAKKSTKPGNTVYLCVFEIDGYGKLSEEYSVEDRGAIFKKMGEIVALYEQPFDVIAQTDDDYLVFVVSRSNKQEALDECDHIVRSVAASNFITSKGALRITLSAAFLAKAPIKSLDDVIQDGRKLIDIAQENGGNRVMQVSDRVDSYR